MTIALCFRWSSLYRIGLLRQLIGDYSTIHASPTNLTSLLGQTHSAAVYIESEQFCVRGLDKRIMDRGAGR